MGNEYYGVATTPTTDYLAHYGVKGMKWGVRKALARGSDRALGRQYRKAQKKLAKLEKRAMSGKKYARRAARLGLGAAAAGGLAAAGTLGVSKGLGAVGSGMSGAGAALGSAANRVGNAKIRNAMKTAAFGIGYAGRRTVRNANAIKNWGGSHSIGEGIKNLGGQALNSSALSSGVGAQAKRGINQALRNSGHGGIGHQINKAAGISNSGYARIAAAGLGAGLAGAAGYNAYRAATTKRAAAKAAAFRKEMNKTFAGTKYANAPRTPQKRRRRG